MKNTVKATFRIVTPMFLGDAEQKAVDIRPPSIKGALRFWWRALNWGRLSLEFSNSEANALERLHKEEGELFGESTGVDSDNKTTGGQGKFLIKIRKENLKKDEFPTPRGSALAYLKGQGLDRRNALIAGQEFTVELAFRPRTCEKELKSVADALYFFGLLGALGSRARHGFGSVALVSWSGVTEYNVPSDRVSYIKAIKNVLAHYPFASKQPPFTAFCKEMRIDLCATDKSFERILTEVANEQQHYRSYGYKGRDGTRSAGGQQVIKPNFQNDHDSIYRFINARVIDKAPARAVFGLPHNYRYSDGKQAQVDYVADKAARRASPLFLHIHSFSDGTFIAVHSLFPAQFLPANEKISITSGSNSRKVPATVDYQVIHNYLNRFEQKETIYGA